MELKNYFAQGIPSSIDALALYKATGRRMIGSCDIFIIRAELQIEGNAGVLSLQFLFTASRHWGSQTLTLIYHSFFSNQVVK